MFCLLAYEPAFRAGFVWDDDANVTENLPLRSAEGLRRLWLQPGATTQYYPLVYTSFWVEYALWGLDPVGYHVTNVLLHAGAAVLLWRVLALLALPGAWFAAAIFALHPVHVESVAWISERKNVLSAVFYLASALVYLGWASDALRRRTRGQRLWGGVLSFLLFAAAMLSKTVTASLPAALLLVVCWKRGGFRWRDVPPLAAMLAFALPIIRLTISMEQRLGVHHALDWEPSFVERCLIAGRAAWFYAGKLAWPANLIFVYPRWQIDAGAAWQYLFPVAGFAVLAALWLLRRRFGSGPLVAVLYFAGTLFPALGFFEVYFFRFSYVADHWQYLASIGLIALAAGAAARAARNLPARASTMLAASLLLVLGVLTWRQSHVFRDLETLWRDSLAKNPESSMVHDNLGWLLYQRGDVDGALSHYRRALEIDPNNPWALNNLGDALRRQGRLAEAVALFERAVAQHPSMRRFDENLRHARRALKAESREERRRARREARAVGAEPAARHLVLISLDTLRADHLGCYGNERVKTPWVDHLASEGILFRDAFAAAPTTLASHASLVTGVHPHTHGVVRNGFLMNDSNQTLAEILRDRGFHTAAFIGSYALHSSFAFDQGFDHFDEEFDLEVDGRRFDQSQRRAEQVTEAVLAHLERAPEGRLFLFVHYFDPHEPFDPPAPYDAMYRPPGGARSSDLRDLENAMLAHQKEALGRPLGWKEVLTGGLTPELVRRAAARPLGHDRDLAALYAGEVSYTDRHVGRLLDALRERGILERAIVVLTADHGQTFWEHGDAWNHGLWVYDTSVRVPLVFRLPGGAGGGAVVDTGVSLVDVAPTLLELLGIEPPPAMEGVSLVPFLRGETRAGRAVFSEATQPRAARFEGKLRWGNARKPKAIREGRWKYVWAPYLELEELFDLEADPGETHDLLEAGDAQVRRRAASLRVRLEAWSDSAQPAASHYVPARSRELEERLRQLGYVSEE